MVSAASATRPAAGKRRMDGTMCADIHLKRIYDEAAPDDGARVLVDRLWPRGVSKVRAALDLWARDVAPSTTLRKWFNHDPARWDEFRRHYRAELRGNAQAIVPISALLGRGPVTLIFAARDEQHNEAVVLREFLLEKS